MLKDEKEVALYTKMVELAGRDPEYDKRFQQYIREGSTLELRELARPFGQYWKDLDFFNIVTGIDSAHLHFADAERLEDEPGWKWDDVQRSEEHTSELQSLMRISYAVFCLKKKKQHKHNNHIAVYRNLKI